MNNSLNSRPTAEGLVVIRPASAGSFFISSSAPVLAGTVRVCPNFLYPDDPAQPAHFSHHIGKGVCTQIGVRTGWN